MSLWLGTTASSFGEQLVTEGLIVHIDPDISASYSGSGATMYNLINNQEQTLHGTFSKNSPGIRLTNTSGTATSNVSRLQVQAYSSIRMISVWLYNIGNPASNYVLDARTGLSNGYVWSGQIGPDWPFMYVNNGSRISSTTSDTFATGSWRMLTFESGISFSDDVTMFARFSNNEGLNCFFGKILFYNKVLSQSEVTKNFNATRSLYGV
jgi:hypothetical protein